MANSAAEKSELQIVPAPTIEKRIFVVRGRQVMLDEDLADLYGVETRVLVQQVKRNAKRLPADFRFQLTKPEAEALRSQIVTSNAGRGRRRYEPYVFTEQGVALLSGAPYRVQGSRGRVAGPSTAFDAAQMPSSEDGYCTASIARST
jgi:hypothetical protein